MNQVPNETAAAEVAATVDYLERGLTEIPLAKALNRIDDWKRKIDETGREDLKPIAVGLGELHQCLTGAQALDAGRIGSVLVRLGEQTEAAEVSASTLGDSNAELTSSLARLGSLLRHAGSALGGSSLL